MDNVRKGLESRNSLWKSKPKLKELMAKRVSDKLRKYDIAKLDYNTLKVVYLYKGRLDIEEKNPEYYVQAILGCCSGYKNSYKGYKWKYLPRKIKFKNNLEV